MFRRVFAARIHAFFGKFKRHTDEGITSAMLAEAPRRLRAVIDEAPHNSGPAGRFANDSLSLTGTNASLRWDAALAARRSLCH